MELKRITEVSTLIKGPDVRFSSQLMADWFQMLHDSIQYHEKVTVWLKNVCDIQQPDWVCAVDINPGGDEI